MAVLVVAGSVACSAHRSSSCRLSAAIRLDSSTRIMTFLIQLSVTIIGRPWMRGHDVGRIEDAPHARRKPGGDRSLCSAQRGRPGGYRPWHGDRHRREFRAQSEDDGLFRHGAERRGDRRPGRRRNGRRSDRSHSQCRHSGRIWPRLGPDDPRPGQRRAEFRRQRLFRRHDAARHGQPRRPQSQLLRARLFLDADLGRGLDRGVPGSADDQSGRQQHRRRHRHQHQGPGLRTPGRRAGRIWQPGDPPRLDHAQFAAA